MVPKTNSVRVETARVDAASVEDRAGLTATGQELVGEGLESPARRLQFELQRSFSPTDEPRWSPRRTLAFVVVTNGLFWAGLIWAAARFG